MAVPSSEVDILKEGVVKANPDISSYAHNMFYRNGSWEVRKGFGQLTQIDSTLGLPPVEIDGGGNYQWDPNADYGYQTHLGSTVTKSKHGHEQIISVFHTRSNTSSNHVLTEYNEMYVVNIYDVNDNTSWEEILYTHTREFPDEVPQYQWHANYETSGKGVTSEDTYINNQNWLEVVKAKPIWFAEYGDSIYFGNIDIGVFTYTPAIFKSRRNQQIHPYTKASGKLNPYGESSLVTKMTPVDGAFSEGYTYVTSSNFSPSIGVSMQTLQRMVFVAGKDLFITDVGNPAAMISKNTISLVVDEDITAIEELNGVLYIFTKNKTYHYTPSDGELVSGGRLTALSEIIGCDGQHLITKTPQGIVWTDTNGMYAARGSMEISKISTKIDYFFIDSISNPLTAFYAENGLTTLDHGEFNSVYRYKDDDASLTYCSFLQAVMLSIPSQNLIVAQMQDKWAFWSTESIVATDLTQPGLSFAGGIQNIKNPFIISNEERLFVVGSTDDQAIVDAAIDNAVALNEDTIDRSYYILEYGRGGGLDRNIDNEDNRSVLTRTKSWLHAAPSDVMVHIKEPIYLEPTFVYPQSTDQKASPIFPGSTDRYDDYLLPIALELETDAPLPVSRYDIRFTFDETHWQPVFRTLDAVNFSTVATEINAVFPSERVFSTDGYSTGIGSTPDPATGREIQCYTPFGVPDIAGNEIRIRFNGNAAPNNWTYHPDMNLNSRYENIICYIPMRRRRAPDTSQDVDLASMALKIIQVEILNAGGAVTHQGKGTTYERSWFFKPASDASVTMAGKRRKDNIAQPVDWAYLSDDITSGDASKIKLRGLRTTVLSRGTSTEDDNGDQGWGGWIWGTFNALFSADRKFKMSQIIDYTNPPVDSIVPESKTKTVRARYFDSSAGIMKDTVYSNDAEWSSVATPADGDYLIDDEQTSEMQISDSVRGKSVRVMVFGHVFNKAERIVIKRLKALVRTLGFIGRRGRG